jgi:hypothetical protein
VTLQTCAPKKFRSRRWGDDWRVSRAQTWERGPPIYCNIFTRPDAGRLIPSADYVNICPTCQYSTCVLAGIGCHMRQVTQVTVEINSNYRIINKFGLHTDSTHVLII